MKCQVRYCNRKLKIETRKKWIDYLTKKTYFVCPNCYKRAKSGRLKGYPFGYKLGLRSKKKIKTIKKEHREKWKRQNENKTN